MTTSDAGYERTINDLNAHAEQLEAENKRLREAHGAWVDGYDQAMHDADSVYIAQLNERDEEIARLRELLARTHKAWMLEASQGDGIMAEHSQVDFDCRAALEGADNDHE